ncbi:MULTISPECIES: GntR family transcriptional regulator [Cohnella]|uniref:GntR family transcriptional regulator n=1 Tax=Cohnella TaxID=329857 RepID=UPI0009B96B1E|nr:MULTISPECIES: GntR family transcriptional regulator [Cohnella]MBN2981300.1 GntR family transcriptional regulator [Cohnella algarum]
MPALSLAEFAYQEIRQKLLNGEYLPGTLLSENELANGLGMSRTPLRDAVMQLEKDGFVETLFKRGILVKQIDIMEVFDIFELLTALYIYALDYMEEYHYKVDLNALRMYLDKIIEASEKQKYREYYESGLMFMGSLLGTIENRVIQETFNRYKDKILFFVVAHRSTKGSNRPYTGKKLYSEIYLHLTEGNFQAAKAAILESKRKSREEVLSSRIPTA